MRVFWGLLGPLVAVPFVSEAEPIVLDALKCKAELSCQRDVCAPSDMTFRMIVPEGDDAAQSIIIATDDIVLEVPLVSDTPVIAWEMRGSAQTILFGQGDDIDFVWARWDPAPVDDTGKGGFTFVHGTCEDQ